MSGSCCSTGKKFDGMDPKYKQILWIVIAINASMFVVEMLGGALSGSQALKADALDFLGDALTYGLSLWAIGKSVNVRTNAALVKGISLLLMGAWVLATTLYQFVILDTPIAPVMGSIAVLALLANVSSVLLLMRYKDGDANVRSVWLCSRNDAISNVLVIAASVAVFVTASAWPDLIVAVIMAFIFTRSAVQIIRQALVERRKAATH